MTALRERLRILVVDDEKHTVAALAVLLEPDYTVLGVASAEEALDNLSSYGPHLVLLDITLPGMDGMECLDRIKSIHPGTEVVMVTATREVRTAVAALKLGAYDYLEKPFEEEDLRGIIRNVSEKIELTRKVDRLGSELARPYAFDNIVGESRAMREVMRLVERVSPRDVNVLVRGETGTGKELIARAVHFNGPRRDGPFVAVNCARFSGDVIESELFGHEKGAFTGAVATHRGVFESAEGGTLFLDEVGIMPYETQGKLLRVLEEKKFRRLGGEQYVAVDVRLVVATNRDLAEDARAGRFREDLYYRLNVVPISVPPLRSRREDIPPLADHFIQKHREHMNSPLEGFTPEAMEALSRHFWRGNVRELENTVLLLMSVSEKNTADVEDLDLPLLRREEVEPVTISDSRAEAEREAILRALEACDWNQSAAAERLGVHRNTLRNRMARLGIPVRRSAKDE